MSGSPSQHLVPVAFQIPSSANFISWLLETSHPPTTLLISSTKEAFLTSLQVDTRPESDPDGNSDANQNNDSQDTASTEQDKEETSNPLLSPTIHLIALSRSIKVAFTPTLPHLRAYLSVYSQQPSSTHESSKAAQSAKEVPMLAVWGLVSLHRSTADYSAQGLSRTLALAVETAHLAGQRLTLAEQSVDQTNQEDGDTIESSADLWRQQIPLLSGSVRVEGGQRVLAEHRIEIGAIVGKWCKLTNVERPE